MVGVETVGVTARPAVSEEETLRRGLSRKVRAVVVNRLGWFAGQEEADPQCSREDQASKEDAHRAEPIPVLQSRSRA
jgi:hypothetical protein